MGEVYEGGKGVDNKVAGLKDVQGESWEDTGNEDAVAVKTIDKDRNSQLLKQKEKEDPWKRARGGPSEQWQPQSWSGGTTAPSRRG